MLIALPTKSAAKAEIMPFLNKHTDHHKIYKGEICIYYFYAARTKDVP